MFERIEKGGGVRFAMGVTVVMLWYADSRWQSYSQVGSARKCLQIGKSL